MYFQKDYVLRMIEMMGDLLRRIRQMISEAEARETLDEVAQKGCGLPLTMLRTTDPDALRDLLSDAQRFLAAELLMIDAEVALRTKPDEEVAPVWAQALAVYATLTEFDYAAPAADRAARLLNERLSVLAVPALLAAADLCERAGLFGAAEDALFAALPEDPEAANRAIAFYDRLDRLSDAALRAGSFSRAEIAEGRRAVNER